AAPPPATAAAGRRGRDTRPRRRGAAGSSGERHAGEADALTAVRVDVLLVMEQLAARPAASLQHQVRRRQAADAAAVLLVGDDAEVFRRVGRLRLLQQHLVLFPAGLQLRTGDGARVTELRAQVRQVAADEVADRLRRLGLGLAQRLDHAGDV